MVVETLKAAAASMFPEVWLTLGVRPRDQVPETLDCIAMLCNPKLKRSMSPKEGESTYLRTGDLGRVDAEGLLYVEGRHKDLIIVNGRNIYPQVI